MAAVLLIERDPHPGRRCMGYLLPQTESETVVKKTCAFRHQHPLAFRRISAWDKLAPKWGVAERATPLGFGGADSRLDLIADMLENGSV